MIPLVLLTGFLGAGKTRFLSTLIPELHTHGLRVRVLLNDFENAAIDAARLAELTAIVTPLAGECVCCTSLEDLLRAMDAVPDEPDTVLLIEANGATETDELLARLSMDARLSRYTLPLQVTVVDAKRWQKRWWHNKLEISQTVTATHLLLNWMHVVSDTRRRAVTESVRAIAPRALLIDEASFARQLRTLADTVRNQAQRPRALPVVEPIDPRTHDHTHTHDHAQAFASALLALPAIVDRTQFTAFVAALPNEVIRAKGFVRFTDRPAELFVWNRVDGRKTLSVDQSWPDAVAQPVALLIGVNLPVAAIGERIAALT
jgi:G3E family GTPase